MRSVGRGLWASEDGHLWRIDHRVEGATTRSAMLLRSTAS